MSPTVRPALLVGLILAAGCGGPPSQPAKQSAARPPATMAAPESAAPTGLPGPTAVAPPAPAAPLLADPDTVATAVAAAKFLLEVVQTGTASLATLTDDLKLRIAPPTTSADKDRTYSYWAAETWLKGFANKVSLASVVGVPVGSAAVGVEAGPPAQGSTSTGPVTRTLARLVKVDGEWKIDWLHVGPPAGPGLADLPAAGGPGRFAVAGFLAAVLSRDAVAAEALLSARAKADLAPPLAGDPGFNRGGLRLKLRGLAGGATGATVRDLDAGKASGELVGPNGPRPFILTLTADGLVDSVDVR